MKNNSKYSKSGNADSDINAYEVAATRSKEMIDVLVKQAILSDGSKNIALAIENWIIL
ncbi:MAG: hypothetical protein P4L50_15050 [Anaerolineaceae bacterium]|nr:hypothetical protein [Anaerolineaceae bacterium]